MAKTAWTSRHVTGNWLRTVLHINWADWDASAQIEIHRYIYIYIYVSVYKSKVGVGRKWQPRKRDQDLFRFHFRDHSQPFSLVFIHLPLSPLFFPRFLSFLSFFLDFPVFPAFPSTFLPFSVRVYLPVHYLYTRLPFAY